MRHAKKLVFLAVLALMVFGLVAAASAATFSDIDKNPAANDIMKLNALGIINGYPDGTFQPAGNITRAEFAKIAVTAAGLKDSAVLLQDSPSAFSDVAAGAWYTGWVNVAASQGYVKGYDDGTFKPDANVTAAEAITVLVRLLGYDDRLPGDWPVDYLAKASSLGITDKLTFSASAPATRGLVAQLTSATLDEDTVSYDVDKEKFVFDTDGTVAANRITLLADSFDSSVVTEDSLVFDYSINDGKWSIQVVPITANKGYTAAPVKKNLADEFAISGAPGPNGLGGQIVDYITNKDGDITYIETKNYGSAYHDSIDLTFSTGNLTKVKVDDKTYDVDTDCAANIGGTYKDADTLGATVANDKVTVYFNEDGDVVYISDAAYKSAAVFKELTTSGRLSAYDWGSQTNPAGDVTDTDKEILVIRNGKVCTLKDLKANDLFWTYKDSKGADWRIVATDAKIEGVLESVSDDLKTVTIDGTDYDAQWLKYSDDNGDNYSTVTAASDLSEILGEKVTVLKSPFGYAQRIIATDNADTNAIYGVVADWSVTTGANPKVTSITIFNKDGKKVTYNTDSDSNDTARDVAGSAPKDFVFRSFVKATLQSNGDINNLTVLGATAKLNAADTDNNRIEFTSATVAADNGWYTDKNMVAFDVSDADSDNWEIATAKDVEDSVDTAAISSVPYKVKDGEIQYVVLSSAVASTSDYAIVLKTGVNADGDYVKVLEGSTVATYDASSVKVTAYGGAADAGNLFADIKEGSVVTYTKSGTKVTKITEVAEENATVSPAFGAANGGAVADTATNMVKIGTRWFAVDSDTVYYDWSDTTGTPAAITLADVVDGDTVIYAFDSNDILLWLVKTDK